MPCQVWTTGFYDKNIVGTANSIAAGLGNSGGGITYFAMPAIYNSLVNNQGLTPHTAWRVSFVVPGIMIVAVAILLVLLCPDTPTGKWSERMQAAEQNTEKVAPPAQSTIVDIPGQVSEESKNGARASLDGTDTPSTITRKNSANFDEKITSSPKANNTTDPESQIGEQQMLDATTRNEVVQAPTMKDVIKISFSPQTVVAGAAYFCTFGAELAVNSILGSYYTEQFTGMAAQQVGNFAAMFGLMNVVWRPLGGVVGDIAYKYTGSVWAKKVLLHIYGVGTGAMLLAIGLVNPTNVGAMIALVAVGLAFFNAGANGLTFSLVPHVHPHANGVVSGFTGACGNLGGIVFAIVFRYGSSYASSIWIIGAICVGINLAVCWVRPVPKGQVGGR